MHRTVMFLIYIITQLQLTIVKLDNVITMETTNIFYSYFCLMLCASFKERKGFTETQAVKL